MKKEEIFDVVKEIIMDKVEVEENQINLDSSLLDDIGADSIEMLDIAMEIEIRLGVKIKSSELASIETIQDVVDFVYNKKNP